MVNVHDGLGNELMSICHQTISKIDDDKTERPQWVHVSTSNVAPNPVHAQQVNCSTSYARIVYVR